MATKTKTAEAEGAKAAVDLLASFAKTNNAEYKLQFIELLDAKGNSKKFQEEFIKALKSDPIIGPLAKALIEFNKSRYKKTSTDPNQLLTAIEGCNNFFNRLPILVEADSTREINILIDRYGADFIVLMHKNRETAGTANQNERILIMGVRELSLSNLIFDVEATRGMLEDLKKAIE